MSLWQTVFHASILTIAIFSSPQSGIADDFRIGILGIDNYGSVAYTEFLNRPRDEGDFAGVQVVAAWPVVSPDYPDSEKLQEQWKQQLLNLHQNPKDPLDTVPPIEIVNSADELLAKCDGVMIFSLDGRMHLAQATAVLKAGKPLFIGRPLAASVEDAVRIFRVAAETKTPCWSSSQHRYNAGFSGMRNHPDVGQVIGCDVYGGWSVDVPEADRFTRPLHSIETLYAIMGRGVVSVSSTGTETAESITAVWGDGRVGTYRGIKSGAVKYSATVFGTTGVSVAGIYGHGVPVRGIVPTDDRYVGYEGLAIEIARFFKGGPLPVSPEETLEIFALLQAAELSRAKQGAMVRLPELGSQVTPDR